MPPAECTLPTAEQPLRVAEFEGLLRELLIGQHRDAPTTLVLDLRGGRPEQLAVADLAARESRCCTFFRFTLTRPGEDRIRLQVEVPDGQVRVLDGLAELATAAGR